MAHRFLILLHWACNPLSRLLSLPQRGYLPGFLPPSKPPRTWLIHTARFGIGLDVSVDHHLKRVPQHLISGSHIAREVVKSGRRAMPAGIQPTPSRANFLCIGRNPRAGESVVIHRLPVAVREHQAFVRFAVRLMPSFHQAQRRFNGVDVTDGALGLGFAKLAVWRGLANVVLVGFPVDVFPLGGCGLARSHPRSRQPT